MKTRPAECFDAVLRAMTADRSISMKEAVRRLNHGCGYSAFKEWIRTHPKQKARIDALRSAPAAEVHFEAIAALIRGGMTTEEACAARPEYPKADTFLHWLHRRPDLLAGIKPAIDASQRAKAKRTKTRLGDRKYDPEVLERALAAIRASDASDLRTVLVRPLPGYSVLQKYAERDPEFAQRFREAIDARPNPNRVRPGDFERALDAIRDNPDKPIAAVLGPANDLPSYPTLQKLASEDPAFATRLNIIVTRKYTDQGKRPKGRKIAPEAYARAIAALKAGGYRSATRRLRDDPALPTLGGLQNFAKRHAEVLQQYQEIMGARRPKASPRPAYVDHQLRRSLNRNDLFRKARALLPGAYDDQRQDQIQDAILAMLESGERIAGKDVINRFCKSNLSRGYDSLDDEVFDGEIGKRRSDMVPASVEMMDVHSW